MGKILKRIFLVAMLAMFLSCSNIFAAEVTYSYNREAHRIDFFDETGAAIGVFPLGEDESFDEDYSMFNSNKSGTMDSTKLRKLLVETVNKYKREAAGMFGNMTLVHNTSGNMSGTTYAISKEATKNKPKKDGDRYNETEVCGYNTHLIIEKLDEILNANGKDVEPVVYFEPSADEIDNTSPGDALSESGRKKYEALKDNMTQFILTYNYSLAELVTTVGVNDSSGDGSSIESQQSKDPSATGSGNWWNDAQSFFNTAQSSGKKSTAAEGLVNELSTMIFNVGNMIFIVVTSILGVKYIFGSAEGKAQIKDSLITLIVAALFFYGWSAISNLLNIGGLLSSGTLESTASKIYNTILFIVNLAAICGVIWIGVKYMLSSAEGRAEIKTSWGPLILGIVMVYATIWFLTTIITTVLQ